jgi:peptidyl-prolyl cis-trans isomerase A (cyclophilin A)
MFKFYIVGVCFLLAGCGSSNSNPIIKISTSKGVITAELFAKQAPKSVTAFLNLVKAKSYNNSSFYRVLKQDDLSKQDNYGVIQGGVHPNKINAPFIEHESTSKTGLRHENGTLSLARTSVGTASTEFFICIGEQNGFNSGNMRGEDSLGFAAFGIVTQGMSIVREIQAEKNEGEYFTKPIKIETIEIE